MIFLLLMKIFSMTVRLSQLETRLQELVQRIALEEMESGRRKSSGNEKKSEEIYDDAENNQS